MVVLIWFMTEGGRAGPAGLPLVDAAGDEGRAGERRGGPEAQQHFCVPPVVMSSVRRTCAPHFAGFPNDPQRAGCAPLSHGPSAWSVRVTTRASGTAVVDIVAREVILAKIRSMLCFSVVCIASRSSGAATGWISTGEGGVKNVGELRRGTSIGATARQTTPQAANVFSEPVRIALTLHPAARERCKTTISPAASAGSERTLWGWT